MKITVTLGESVLLCIPSQHILLQDLHPGPRTRRLLPDPLQVAIEIRQHEKKSHQSDHITVPDTHKHTHTNTHTHQHTTNHTPPPRARTHTTTHTHAHTHTHTLTPLSIKHLSATRTRGGVMDETNGEQKR